MRLEGKKALITGGTSGIGKGIAKEFLAEGAKVVIAGKNVEKGLAAEKELGENCKFIPADMTSDDSVAELVKQAIDELETFDILVNNAGYTDGKGVETQTVEEWNNIINTNVNGYARCIRNCLPYLKASQGNMLNVSSMVGKIGQNNSFGYCATKGAIIGMSKNLAIDLAPYKIRVNVLCPGWIVTELMETFWATLMPRPETALQELADAHPLKKYGTPRDCGKAAVYLCSDDASFVNGITLNLDGGITLGYTDSILQIERANKI